MVEVGADTGFVDSSPTVAREGEGRCLLLEPHLGDCLCCHPETVSALKAP